MSDKPESWWVGRCKECNAARAVDVDDPTEIAKSGYKLSLEPAPVQFSAHICGWAPQARRRRK